MARKGERSQVLATLRRASRDEAVAVDFIEGLRWGDEPACPRCGDSNVYQMRDRKTGERERHFRWRCRGCRKMFSVRTGTVFEETRLPLRVWCHAFWRACASKKGVSALQISRECEITHKSALYLLHRIRLAMLDDPNGQPLLAGTVEADETFVGGKPRYKLDKRSAARRRVAEDKPVVFAMVERGGRVRAKHVPEIHAGNLKAEIRANVDPRARIMTDEARYYIGIGADFEGGHETVKHRDREYVRGDVTTNTVEGFFALFKRGIYGTFHNISRHHLHRYVAEFEFRYNARGVDDGARVVQAIRGAEGKRLLYREPSKGA